MKDDKLSVVKAWFRKAENDLINAEYTMKMENPKTHSIEDLVLLCKQVVPSIESDVGDVEILSSYGVEIRYPDEIYYDIPAEDAREAVELSKMVKFVVLKYLGGEDITE